MPGPLDRSREGMPHPPSAKRRPRLERPREGGMSLLRSPDDFAAIGRVIEPNRIQTKRGDRFEIIDVDNVDISNEAAWLVDKIMPATGLAVIYGLPKSGKSF